MPSAECRSTQSATADDLSGYQNREPALFHRLKTFLLFFVALATFSGSGSAVAHAAHLKTGFGTGGIEFLPRQFSGGTGVGLLGGGRVVVADGKELMALQPSGQVDRSFGIDGYAAYEIPTESAGAYASSMRVDPQGRPVMVGEAGLPESSFFEPAKEPLVERFTPDGVPDPEFGNGTGYVVGGIKLPPPYADGPPNAAFYDLGFDVAGRIVLAGGTQTGSEYTKNGPIARYSSFLARLQNSGAVDESFADAGTYLGPESGLAVAPGGELILRTAVPANSDSLFRLDEDGNPDHTFGAEGQAPYPSAFRQAPFKVDPDGRTVLRASLPATGRGSTKGLQILRLKADGSIDRSFGRNGVARLPVPGFHQSQMAFDDQGRILLEISQLKRLKDGSASSELVLMRLSEDGGIDRSFGEGGRLRIPTPGGAKVFTEGPRSFAVQGDQAVVMAVIKASGKRRRRPFVALVDL